MAGTHHKFTILQWNIRGIHSNKAYLQHNITTYRPDVILLQETLERKEKNNIINGYTEPISIPYSSEPTKKNTGIATYISTDYSQELLEKSSSPYLDTTTIKIQNKHGQNMTLTNIYRKHTSKNKENITHLKTHLEKINKKYEQENHLIAGDFNLHHPLWEDDYIENLSRKKDGNDTQVDSADKIAETIQNNDMTILNDGRNTRLDNNRCDGAIDLTIINKKLTNTTTNWKLIDDNEEGDRGNSDHLPIIIEIGQRTDRTDNRYKEKGNEYNYRNLDKTRLKKELGKIDWKHINNHTEVNELDNELNKILINTLDKVCKKKKTNNHNKKKTQTPWWNETCQIAINKKKQASKTLQKNKTEENKIAYNKIKNETNRTIIGVNCKL